MEIYSILEEEFLLDLDSFSIRNDEIKEQITTFGSEMSRFRRKKLDVKKLDEPQPQPRPPQPI